ncbi:MAG TPA: glutamyl-tRNA reductase [Candidatus Bathyarchaeia archaeon]|nr:glutamyl-tRNA reductase [Candidatus Bathyarchaeia archaeon]
MDHKTAPLAILEMLAPREPEEFYKVLQKLPTIKGSVILRTCNRVEFYLDMEPETDLDDNLLRYWALESKFKRSQLGRILRERHGSEVVEHIIRLGSGLESMLVGEPQILGQLKEALAESQTHGAASPLLRELFEKTMKAASKIREETGIGRGTVSIGSAAIKISEEILGDIKEQSVLLIGTGQVATLTMKALRARDLNNIVVAGRTHERAESFCHSYGGTPIAIAQLQGYLAFSDLVIVATTARDYLLTKADLVDVNRKTFRPRVMILDLSVPRNVSPEVAELHGVTLKTLEDLKGITDATSAKRRQIVKDADHLVKAKTEDISNLLRRRSAEPIVSEIYERAEQIRAELLEKTLPSLSLDPSQKRVLENMTVSLIEKILEKPAVRLRKAAERGDAQVLTVAGNIFGAEDN